MTSGLGIFIISFVFSFLGSIPPGSINLSVLSLSIEGNRKAAVRFALAAALIEYPYAYIALRFEEIITGTVWVNDHFHLLSASIMIILGLAGMWRSEKSSSLLEKYRESGFRKGIVISILNPLAIPFWIGVTAYLRSQGWVMLHSETALHIYVLGVSAGTFTLLLAISYIAKGIGQRYKDSVLVKYTPAVVLLLLGLYSLSKLIFQI